MGSGPRLVAQRPPLRRIRWTATYRIVSDRYPPIAAFERIADAADLAALDELERFTDPAQRQQAGQISLVPKERRVFGRGASAAMAPFVHASTANPSRFTDGSYGIYYAGRAFETALAEVAFHRARFHAATGDPPLQATFLTHVAPLDASLHDIRGDGFARYLKPDLASYPAAQAFAARLRGAGSNGLVYPSVRHATGECLAAFWPDVIGRPKPGKRLALKWDGRAIVAWFDFETERWTDLTP